MPHPNTHSLITLLLLFLATIAVAAPVDSIDKRAPIINGWFRMCPVTNFGEPCQTVGWTSKKCQPVPPRLEGAVKAASPRPDYNAQCLLFRDSNCAGPASRTISYPGFVDLAASGHAGTSKSFVCHCGDECKVVTKGIAPPVEPPAEE